MFPPHSGQRLFRPRHQHNASGHFPRRGSRRQARRGRHGHDGYRELHRGIDHRQLQHPARRQTSGGGRDLSAHKAEPDGVARRRVGGYPRGGVAPHGVVAVHRLPRQPPVEARRVGGYGPQRAAHSRKGAAPYGRHRERTRRRDVRTQDHRARDQHHQEQLHAIHGAQASRPQHRSPRRQSIAILQDRPPRRVAAAHPEPVAGHQPLEAAIVSHTQRAVALSVPHRPRIRLSGRRRKQLWQR